MSVKRDSFPVWKIAPGELGFLWDECLKGGYICIGWDDIGDLKQYPDFEALTRDFWSVYKKNKNTDGTPSLWPFLHNVKTGDIVIANQGREKVLGIGVIISDYISPEDPSNPRIEDPTGYKHLRKVKWLKSGQIPVSYQFGIATLTGTPSTLTAQGITGSDKNRFKEIVKGFGITPEEIFKECQMAEAAMVGQECSQNLFKLVRGEKHSFKQLILQGPPGTGKTYEAKRLAAKLVFGDYDIASNADKFMLGRLDYNTSSNQTSSSGSNGAWEIVQFHPAYNYEDFVRGIQVQITQTASGSFPNYLTVNRVFASMCQEAAKKGNESKQYVLIIDEINRANIAAVMGELIYALEYRNEPVRTPYAPEGEGFEIRVPENLYVIGTMNTADRSIGHLDYAVRRRFAFHALLPRVEAIQDYTGFESEQLRNGAIELFKAVGGLFVERDLNGELTRKRASTTLNAEFHPDDVQPGHTYFMARTPEELAAKFSYQLYPLLREYAKDGILMEESQVRLGSDIRITVDPPEDPENMEKQIQKWLLLRRQKSVGFYNFTPLFSFVNPSEQL